MYHHQELVRHVRGRSSNIWSTAMHPRTSLDLTECVLKLLSNLVFTDNLRHCIPPLSGYASLQNRQLFVYLGKFWSLLAAKWLCTVTSQSQTLYQTNLNFLDPLRFSRIVMKREEGTKLAPTDLQPHILVNNVVQFQKHFVQSHLRCNRLQDASFQKFRPFLQVNYSQC